MSNVIQVLKPYFRVDETISEIKECLEKGWTGIGFKTEQFEVAWKKYSGFEYAHFINSATSGLHLAFKIFKDKYNWQDGDEVITTSLTFVSTNHAILYEQLDPVFADIDSSLCLDPNSVERLITNKTKAVIYVGIGGNAQNYKEIRALCTKYNLIFILDAAHMAGTTWVDTGLQVGLDADCAVFSYQAVKNCPSSDSGMICFSSSELDKQVRRLSWLGIDKTTYDRYSESSYKWRYDVPDVGFKYHGNSIVAALCLVSLRYLDQDNEYRRTLTEVYDTNLKGKGDIEIIAHSELINSSRHLYQIAVTDRDTLIERLSKEGIYCGVHYIANHQYSIYEKYKSDVEKAGRYSSRIISLPMHLGISEADAVYISKKILNK
ncbi:MAG: aminotransferase class V-fold PLP-dependent enzyme [Deltaproteobacteria bacterium]